MIWTEIHMLTAGSLFSNIFKCLELEFVKIINYSLHPHFYKNAPQYGGGVCLMPALMPFAPGSIRIPVL